MESSSDTLNLCGKQVFKKELAYYIQITLIYIVVIVCLINISLNHTNTSLWTNLLSSCIGYVLPAPKLKTRHAGVSA